MDWNGKGTGRLIRCPLMRHSTPRQPRITVYAHWKPRNIKEKTLQFQLRFFPFLRPYVALGFQAQRSLIRRSTTSYHIIWWSRMKHYNTGVAEATSLETVSLHNQNQSRWQVCNTRSLPRGHVKSTEKSKCSKWQIYVAALLVSNSKRKQNMTHCKTSKECCPSKMYRYRFNPSFIETIGYVGLIENV